MLLWPAFRVDPVGTLLKMAQFTERVGGGEHDNYLRGGHRRSWAVLLSAGLAASAGAALAAGVIVLAVMARRLDINRRWAVLTLGSYCVGFMR